MVLTQIESVPQLWDEERDAAFFRLVSQVFSADFLYGASVLLASNDPDTGYAVEETAQGRSPADESAYKGRRAAAIRSAT